MQVDVPFIGHIYKIVAGPYAKEEFKGKCVRCDLSNPLPVILMNEKFETRAAKLDEIELAYKDKPSLPKEQDN